MWFCNMQICLRAPEQRLRRPVCWEASGTQRPSPTLESTSPPPPRRFPTSVLEVEVGVPLSPAPSRKREEGQLPGLGVRVRGGWRWGSVAHSLLYHPLPPLGTLSSPTPIRRVPSVLSRPRLNSDSSWASSWAGSECKPPSGSSTGRQVAVGEFYTSWFQLGFISQVAPHAFTPHRPLGSVH